MDKIIVRAKNTDKKQTTFIIIIAVNYDFSKSLLWPVPPIQEIIYICRSDYNTIMIKTVC
jgi:hypothetical protein